MLFADALSAIFRTVALNCTNIPRYIPSTLGPHPSRPTFFDNNIGDWYEMRFYRLKGTTTKQVNYIRGQPHLLAVDPTISSLPRQDSASSNKGLYPVMGLHFQGGMKGWMATYRVDPRTHCQNFTCVCMSETCEECYC